MISRLAPVSGPDTTFTVSTTRRDVCTQLLALRVLMLVLIAVPAIYSVPVVAADYRIESVQGNVYRFVNDRHRSVFAVTGQGIIATDPLNDEAAAWLRAELEERFGLPIRYIIYSHNHSDHVYGTEMLMSSGTTVVAHRLTAQDLAWTQAATVMPNVVFDNEMTLRLDDTTVELRYHGPNDGRGSVSMLFRPANVLFIIDWVVVGRMPWQKLWSYDIHGMINSTKSVLELDFDRFVGGHADVGNKEDVERYLSYLQALYDEVVTGIRNGASLDQLKKEIRLDEYNDLQHYEEWLPMNIEGVYERLMEESGMGWRPDLP